MNSSAHRIESRFISQTYKYDAANRLIGSNGNMSQEYSTALPYGYQSNYKYTLAGKLLNKYVDSKRLSTAMGPYTARYDNEYSYTHPNNPYAVTHIQDAYGAHYDFSWSANGNLDKSYAYATHTDRRLCWTEDNRLQAFMERGDEGGIAAYYNYTADGERNIKLTSPRLNMHQNASQFNNPPLFIPTLYASPLITLTPKGYTKHYFEEGRRVCSKLGGWFLWRVPADDIRKPVEEVKDNYEEQHNQQRQGVHETFGKCIGAWPELIDKYDLLKMLLEYKEEEKNFYYHSDHLGSAAYLTSGGDVTQTLNYLPYGEDWIDVQNNMDPRLGQYRFNGKEKDYESGFHYYGARYYWSEVLTGWLSVDPMMDKYPFISPYAYCAWNPIILVDPDGRDTSYYNLDGRLQFVKKGGSTINMMIVTRKDIDEKTFNKGGYYAFDVNDIDFNNMDDMYNNSAKEGANEWYYRVRIDGTSTTPKEVGPKGGMVKLDKDDKFMVHTHTLDDAVEKNSSNLDPSKDKDCVGIGDRFGIILGYSKKGETSSSTSYGGITANRNDFIPSVSFYDHNGMIKLGGKSPTYKTFKEKVQNLQTR